MATPASAEPNAAGVLVAIVGPSGAGKDTLMDAARAALAGDSRFVFARRVITRPAGAGGEDHEAATPDAFAAREAAGGLALAWQAHGLGYGLPATVRDEIAGGRVVIANLSRRMIGAAEAAFPKVAVVEITAPVAVLARRLAARGRESEAEIAGRLAREAPLVARHAPVHRLANDRDLGVVAAEFVALLGSFVR